MAKGSGSTKASTSKRSIEKKIEKLSLDDSFRLTLRQQIKDNRGNDSEVERLEDILSNKTKEYNSYNFARSEMHAYNEALKFGIMQERREYLAYSNASSLIKEFKRTREAIVDVSGYSERQFVKNYKEIISKSTLFKDLRKFATDSRYKKEIQELLDEVAKIK